MRLTNFCVSYPRERDGTAYLLLDIFQLMFSTKPGIVRRIVLIARFISQTSYYPLACEREGTWGRKKGIHEKED